MALGLTAGAMAATTTSPSTQPAPGDLVGNPTVVDLDAVSHQPLRESNNCKAVVLLFVAVDCPISNNYAPELRRVMTAETQKGFDFRLVYCDVGQMPAAIKAHRAAFGYTCPALLDPQHVLARAVGATVTPEAAVVRQGRVVYLGRIDDRWADFGVQRPAATVHDLTDALQRIADGRPIATSTTPAVGCPIEN